MKKDGNELTVEYIIILHDDVIERLGGVKGVLNQGTIDHLIYCVGVKGWRIPLP